MSQTSVCLSGDSMKPLQKICAYILFNFVACQQMSVVSWSCVKTFMRWKGSPRGYEMYFTFVIVSVCRECSACATSIHSLLLGQVMVETEVVEALSFPTCRNRQAPGGSLSPILLRPGWAVSLNPGRPWTP